MGVATSSSMNPKRSGDSLEDHSPKKKKTKINFDVEDSTQASEVSCNDFFDCLEKMEHVNDDIDEVKVKEVEIETREIDKFSRIINNNLKCVKCGNLPRNLPVMICSANHIACLSCYQSLFGTIKCVAAKCNQKMLEYQNTPLISDLLVSVDRRCTYCDNGCSVQTTIEELLLHESSCVFQDVNCWICGNTVPLNNFHNHRPNLECFHEQRIHSSPGKARMCFRKSLPLAISVCGELFYLRISRIKSRSVWIAYVATQLVSEDCKLFLTSFTLSSIGPGSHPSFSYSGPPSSLVSSLEDVLKSGNCLVLTDPGVNNMIAASQKPEFSMSFDIKRCK